MNQSAKMRLDQLLVEKFGYESRSRARDAVLRGCVFLGGKKLTRPGQALSSDCELDVRDAAGNHVSRAALKLVKALDEGRIDVTGKTALDLGASTGGFTQVLLERGAKRVFAIDVGSGQLHASLETDDRVISIENLNVRDLAVADMDGERPEIVTSDLSFISLKLALPPALDIAADNAIGIFLVKPQFEVGRNHIGSGGIVRNDALIAATVADLVDWLNSQDGWQVTQTLDSPITGGDGNREFLMIAKKDNPHATL